MSNTKNILGFYHGSNAGVLTNLARMLNHGVLAGTGKMVILPVDQGFEHGPAKSFDTNPVAYDPCYHFELAIRAGLNAYAAPLGFLEAGAAQFAGQIPLILKLNNSDALYGGKDPYPAVTASVDDALRLGCVAIGFTIYPGSSMRKGMYEEIHVIAEEAKRKGLPVVIWSYPRGSGISKQGETALDVVAYAAHIAAQLGAHIIKVKLPTNHIENTDLKNTYTHDDRFERLAERVKHIVKASFVGKRIVIFSGGEAKDDKELLEEIRSIKAGGGYGSIIGRNSFKRPPDKAFQLLKQVTDIYKAA
jgi:class I fructose-bisphosphate aldolase